jgi:predicted transposase YbfD/YdcC
MFEVKSFISHFTELEDPRISGLVTYPLNEILLCTLCGIICRSSDWEEISCWGKYHIKWLRKFLPFKSGIPRPNTFARVFNALDSKRFKCCFEDWVNSLSTNLKGKQVAIDGKTIRGSKFATDGSGAVHIVSAFAHEYGLVLGQEKVSEKSNEITAIPELLTNLALEGSVISIDAMGTQKEIVRQIVNKKADYVLSLKGNQKSLYDDVILFLNNLDKDVIYDEYEDTDAGHGRIEVRNCMVVKEVKWLNERHPEWNNLSSIARVDSIRIDKKTLKEQRQTRYYISSLMVNAKSMLSYVRNHWSVENKLHWILDMNFKEDSCRTRIDHGAENLAIVRKIALNLIRNYNPDDKKITVKHKMMNASYDPNYLKSLLFAKNL